MGWVEVRFDVLAVLAEPGRPVTVQHYRGAF
jgi:putative endonuclease